MAELGLNVSKDALVTARDLHNLGSLWVRLVADADWQDTQVRYCRELRDAGLKVFLTFDADSYRRFGDINEPATWDAAARWGKETFGGLINVLCPTNEPDGEGFESSRMTVATVNGILRAQRDAWRREVTIVGVGSVSGQADYYWQVETRFLDGIDFHPYAQWSIADLSAMIDRHAALGLPLWISEVGLDAPEDQQAVFLEWTLQTIKARADVRACMWFCAHPYGDWGLMRADGTWKPAAAAFTRVAGPLPKPKPEPEPKPKPQPEPIPVTIPEASYRAWWTAVRHDADYNHGRGFEEYWRNHMGELGPTLDDHEFPDSGYQWRTFQGGALRWSSDKGVELVLKP